MQEITRTVLVEWDELNTLDVPLMLDKDIIFFSFEILCFFGSYMLDSLSFNGFCTRKLQARMMTFLLHITIDFREGFAPLGMEDLQL